MGQDALMRALETTSYANEEEEEELGMGRARSLVMQGLSRSGLMDSWDPSFRPGLQQTSHLYMLPAESHHEHTANEPDVSPLLDIGAASKICNTCVSQVFTSLISDAGRGNQNRTLLQHTGAQAKPLSPSLLPWWLVA